MYIINNIQVLFIFQKTCPWLPKHHALKVTKIVKFNPNSEIRYSNSDNFRFNIKSRVFV